MFIKMTINCLYAHHECLVIHVFMSVHAVDIDAIQEDDGLVLYVVGGGRAVVCGSVTLVRPV